MGRRSAKPRKAAAVPDHAPADLAKLVADHITASIRATMRRINIPRN